MLVSAFINSVTPDTYGDSFGLNSTEDAGIRRFVEVCDYDSHLITKQTQ